MTDDDTGRKDQEWPRIPEDPKLLAGYYAGLAERLTDVVTRLGAFDRALSTLPKFLLSFGIAVFAAGIVLHVYEPGFGPSEVYDMTLFAIVFVLASAVIYIAEIRIRDAAERDKQAVEAAREALEALTAAGKRNVPALPSTGRRRYWNLMLRPQRRALPPSNSPAKREESASNELLVTGAD